MKLHTMKRPIAATLASLSTLELNEITDVLIDNRAVGYRATSVSGRDSSFEHLAEIIAYHDLEMDLAGALQDGELISLVFDKLFPKRETLKFSANQGVLTMPMLVKQFRVVLPGDGPARTALSQIMAELTANAIRHLNLILPFDGFVSLTPHTEIFPNADVILEAARVKRITDVLESMRLDPEIGRVKTLSAAALYSALQPMFTRAGRMLLQTVEQDQYLKDTLLLLRLYVTQDPALPRVLLGNDDLRALSTNLTYVLAAVSQELRDIVLPEYFLASAISDSALRLRELKRFSTKHISEVKQWYVHYSLYDNPGQRVVGLVFGRNLAVENRPQVTAFNQVESANQPLWTQTGMAIAENRVEPILTQLVNTELKCQNLAALAAGVATYLHNDPTEPGSVLFANGATEIELYHYAAAVSRRILLSLEDSGYTLAFMNEDVELHYNSQSAMLGTKVISGDPAEAVIHSGLRENVGDGAVPSRIQGIPDSARHQLLLSNPDQFCVSLGAPIEIELDLDGLPLTCKTSLADLLVLPKQLRLSLTRSLAMESVVRSFFQLMLAMARSTDLTSHNEQIANLRAATALSNLLLSVGASPAGRALTRSVFLKLIKSVPPEKRDDVRGQLRHATLSYRVALLTGAKLLVALSLVEDEEAMDAISLINSSGLDKFMIGSIPNLSDLV